MNQVEEDHRCRRKVDGESVATFEPDEFGNTRERCIQTRLLYPVGFDIHADALGAAGGRGVYENAAVAAPQVIRCIRCLNASDANHTFDHLEWRSYIGRQNVFWRNEHGKY